jgi:AmiR/NasT family two-component response regulator
MSESLRIAVADDERDTREYLEQMLIRLGHQVATASTGRELVDLCASFKPDLIVTDIKMPDLDGFEAAELANRVREVPVVLVSGHHGPELLKRVGADHIMAYLIKPISQQDVEAAIYLARIRFGQYLAVRQEAASLRQALEDRKQIERAKGIIMRRLGLGEEESFRRLRKLASNDNRKVIDVAQSVLEADTIFQALEKI